MLDLKQNENLKMLTSNVEQQERVLENIKSEINTYQHQSIGLGRRMPVPDKLEPRQAVKMQREHLDRVIQVYAKNSHEKEDVERVQKVCHCIADDEFFTLTGLEPEQVEIFLDLNKKMVKEMRSDRSHSYDYLQKNDDVESEKDGES